MKFLPLIQPVKTNDELSLQVYPENLKIFKHFHNMPDNEVKNRYSLYH
jgi:hypothetical protein